MHHVDFKTSISLHALSYLCLPANASAENPPPTHSQDSVRAAVWRQRACTVAPSRCSCGRSRSWHSRRPRIRISASTQVRPRPTAPPVTRCHSSPRREAHGTGRLLVTGENRISWPVGCCEGDLVVIDFRDEQADGNDGSGMLYLNNTYVQSYRIQCAALCTPPCCHGLSPHSPL